MDRCVLYCCQYVCSFLVESNVRGIVFLNENFGHVDAGGRCVVG